MLIAPYILTKLGTALASRCSRGNPKLAKCFVCVCVSVYPSPPSHQLYYVSHQWKESKMHMAPPQCFGVILLCSPATNGAHWHINAIRIMAVSQWRSASTTQTNANRGKRKDSESGGGSQKGNKLSDEAASLSLAQPLSRGFFLKLLYRPGN